jgi:hypothetical protein
LERDTFSNGTAASLILGWYSLALHQTLYYKIYILKKIYKFLANRRENKAESRLSK